MATDGILNLDKPKGWTSFDAVARVRRLSGERRVGHAGTLDPDATGVLVICLGRATRLVEFLADTRKVYRAEIELGATTDTYDASGRVVERRDASDVNSKYIEDAAAAFVGLIDQIPPAYSALKHRGVPLYRWARAGIEVPRVPRQVEFFRIELVDWTSPIIVLDIECGKGAYVRSLAHDLGSRLGCGAHLRDLVRSQSGPFRIEDAVGMERVEDALRSDEWAALVQPMDRAVEHLPAVTARGAMEEDILNGRAVGVELGEASAAGLCRAYGAGGEFIAILARDDEEDCWRPRKVFLPRPPKS